MRYYKFAWSLDSKVIGRAPLPQIESVCDDIDNPLYIFNAFRNYKKVDRQVLIPNARLRTKTTKLTDLISKGSYGFSGKLLMSDKLKTSIENSKHVGVQFFKTTVFDFACEKEFPYWLANVYIFFPEYIDYKQSEILVTTVDGKGKERIYVDSYEDFEHKQSVHSPRDFEISKAVLFENKIEYDFFSVNKMHDVVSYFVSEKLKAEIEKAGCTGIDFIEI